MAKPLLLFSSIVCLTVNLAGAATNDFLCQTITLPEPGYNWRFEDVDGDHRADLLALDSKTKSLFIYRQTRSGFTNSPSQVIKLPPRTGWVALHDVDPQPGLELVISTADGIYCLRQSNGVFDTEPHTLVAASQVFTNDQIPLLVWLTTNGTLPIISATEAVVYRFLTGAALTGRIDASGWTRDATIPLQSDQASWWSRERSGWSMGSESGHHLEISRPFRAKQEESEAEKTERKALGKLIESVSADKSRPGPQTSHADLNRDGRKDLVLWQNAGELDTRTDVYVFLRGADGQLPERPTQALHCRGLPIPIGSTGQPSPIAHLKGDGDCQLVLLEPKSTPTSVNSALEMILSRGMDWMLTIRTFNQDRFSPTPDTQIPVTSILPIPTIIPIAQRWHWAFFIAGDFNRDGRPDLVLQHSATRWNIHLSTVDGRWFEAQPRLSFETPAEGFLQVSDLQGDGPSDLVLRADDGARIFTFLNQATKTRQP